MSTLAIWAQLEAKPGKEKEAGNVPEVRAALSREGTWDRHLVCHQDGSGEIRHL